MVEEGVTLFEDFSTDSLHWCASSNTSCSTWAQCCVQNMSNNKEKYWNFVLVRRQRNILPSCYHHHVSLRIKRGLRIIKLQICKHWTPFNNFRLNILYTVNSLELSLVFAPLWFYLCMLVQKSCERPSVPHTQTFYLSSTVITLLNGQRSKWWEGVCSRFTPYTTLLLLLSENSKEGSPPRTGCTS